MFNDLKDLCSLTDGNLSRHLQVLHEAGLVEVWKGFPKNRPQTLCRLSDEGRRRFLEYINVLENVVADALAATRPPRTRACQSSDGLSPGLRAEVRGHRMVKVRRPVGDSLRHFRSPGGVPGMIRAAGSPGGLSRVM